jgi:hypothetical protein
MRENIGKASIASFHKEPTFLNFTLLEAAKTCLAVATGVESSTEYI